MSRLWTVLAICVIAVSAIASPPTARGVAGIDPENRPVADIRVEGLKTVSQQLVLNQIRLKKGDPYAARIVSSDLKRLQHLNKIGKIDVKLEPQEDGSIVVVYVVEELPLIADVKAVGNRKMPDQELFRLVRLRAGDPVSGFLIERAKKQIVAAYEKKGHFDTSVSTDDELLRESGILLFQVVEGPTVSIRAFKLEGNKSYTDKQLLSKIRSKKYSFFGLLGKGELSRQRLRKDGGALRKFYQNRGYLDADAFPEIQRSADGREAVVTFTIVEGERYIVDSVVVQGNKVFSKSAILEMISLRVGDMFTTRLLGKSRDALKTEYDRLGFVESRVTARPLFNEQRPNRVEVLIAIKEGRPYWVGPITVKGNDQTQNKVVLRQTTLMPNRVLNGNAIDRTQRRLQASALFKRANVTILGDIDDTHRPVLIEVEEANTGSLGFGAGISSDSGVAGTLNMKQRNFDILDFPETIGEFFSGKAFRGAGQSMSIDLQPGDIASRYSVRFREPYLFDSSVFLDTTGFFFERERTDYDEKRTGGVVGMGQRFGEVYSASVRGRIERIDITDIDADAPTDVFAVAGDSTITSLGISLTRSTVDSGVFPTVGSRLTLAASRAGALGGDYDFTRVDIRYHKFWTLEEDFFGRRTTFSARIRGGVIFDDGKSPVFERFFAGGHRTFRGFEFRGIGPRGIRADTGADNDVAVGGDWLFLFGVEYNFPVYEDVLRAVIFVDTGTVEEDFGFDEYRISAGAGIRLKTPFLGRAPFAIDIAIPIAKESGDETQPVSFSIAIPF